MKIFLISETYCTPEATGKSLRFRGCFSLSYCFFLLTVSLVFTYSLQVEESSTFKTQESIYH